MNNKQAILIALCFYAAACLSCSNPGGGSQRLTQRQVNEYLEKQKGTRGRPVISEEAAIKVAKDDARNAYGDLDRYEIAATEQADGWHIRFDLKDKSLNGGGPAYIIDKQTGKILDKKYYQ